MGLAGRQCDKKLSKGHPCEEKAIELVRRNAENGDTPGSQRESEKDEEQGSAGD
jgi:hypothetical protein